MKNLLNITDKQYRLLKKAYLKALKEGKTQFVLWEQDILTQFAKYWLEAVENRRKRAGLKIYNPRIKGGR